MRIAIKFAYNGKKYHGYARQPKLRTVEGAIIQILADQGIMNDTKKSRFQSASRTDKGVSALGNVVAFNTDASESLIRSTLQAEIVDILVYGIKEVTSVFYPLHALQRRYRYYLRKDDLDRDKLLSTSALFTGEHDFSNFARVERFRDPIRVIDNIVVGEMDEFYCLDFFARTFLWQQIRRITEVMVKVNRGIVDTDQIIDALEKPNCKVDFGISPPEPLLLLDVLYDFEFEYSASLRKNLDDFEISLIKSL